MIFTITQLSKVLSFVLGIKLVDRKLHRQTLVSLLLVYTMSFCVETHLRVSDTDTHRG